MQLKAERQLSIRAMLARHFMSQYEDACHVRKAMSTSTKVQGVAAKDLTKDALPARRIGDQVKLHRRELMAAEFERIALDLFVTHGYGNVSVEDIAEAAGVSTRTFYRYFAAKEEVLTLYPQRLSEFVREAMKGESPDRPIFDAFSSVLVRLATWMDLDELRQWCTALTSDPQSYGSMALHQLDMRRDVEPLFTNQFSENPTASMHFELALSAGQIAISTAAMKWFAGGGDLVDLVQEAMDVFARGFDDLEATRPS
jgi:AcrR family transcriptional regulator